MIDNKESEGSNANQENEKTANLAPHTTDSTGEFMTTNTGLRVNDDQNSLKAGDRGATLLEDFILREKITHFDHERIPERVVHARGSGAHGVFKVYEPMSAVTKAGFLNDTSIETPVFVRFSTVAGSKGSTDLARDVRGFAVKFYTQEGNFDLVGNNMPVFFIQDAIKFPDLVHAVKPEPDNEMPQAASAHDTFWDFISLMPESAHMIMWLMSDRAIPRSYRMMEGFGVHTFRFINEEGVSHFVKFHWKPLLGVHSVAWDEAQKISGKDPDFHRRDLWDAIESGNFPEWELGVQIVPEEDEFKFDFDLLDPTKIIPEELVPVQRIGKMTLNRNPDNFFAETEQVAYHLGHIVPGIDFTNDPLLQGRLFSYTDTQLLRLGGPNFQEIPINRPIVRVDNNQRDGHMRQTINRGKSSYNPNTLGGGFPAQAKASEGGFTSYPERIDAKKIRARSKSFFDHFSQAKLFFDSQSDPEKNHIVDALSFELGKVKTVEIRQRMVGILSLIDKGLAAEVAFALRVHVPQDPELPINHSIPADGDPADYDSVMQESVVTISDALSMVNTPKDSIQTRKIAFLAADGVDEKSITTVRDALVSAGAVVEIISTRHNYIMTESDTKLPVDHTFLTAASVLYDAVYVPGGTNSVASIEAEADAVHFLNEAFKHCKPIASDLSAIQVLEATYFSKKLPADYDDATILKEGLVVLDDVDQLADKFILAISQHRFWEREKPRKIPA
ncbi:catalase [Dyadobacter chenhuakuii]|uniref:Catalase n=1 Tax=Dyadobacter chenhuakuii TaxID=2909339 RepID=A0A9X1TRQ3_9BACT|nr:catalase [Dyadobacter chenhuakuii]MCF2495124.1 catalase [Dyadobacter chenhuakuii]MCF2498204.1 catalase [Dyadobacter chenhuakuii]USJ31565.1 catalase [Dyadobacter chenhuakuii]